MQLSARMPDLASLEVLLSIARTGSLGAAGRECGLSQQAVSARVVAMETQTGVRLVIRTKTGSRLTASGAVAAQWFDQLVAVAHEVDAGLATLREGTRAQVRVSASLTVAEQLFPRWLVTLNDAAVKRGTVAPEVILTAANSEHVIAAVHQSQADVGFIESPGLPRGLQSKVVARDELVVVVPADHRWVRRASPISTEELSRTPLVTREAGSGTRDFLTAALKAAVGEEVTEAAPALELSTATAIRAAVLADAGPAVLSRLAVQDDLELGRLRAVAVADLNLHRALRAIWLGSRTPPAGAVRDLLSHIAGMAKPGPLRKSQ